MNLKTLGSWIFDGKRKLGANSLREGNGSLIRRMDKSEEERRGPWLPPLIRKSENVSVRIRR